MREVVSQGGELLPNETRQDETRPGSVRGGANGEGQSVARIPAVDHQQCSGPEQHVDDDTCALHATYLWYGTAPHADEESPVTSSRSHMEKPWKRAQGPSPKTMNNLSNGKVSKFACMS